MKTFEIEGWYRYGDNEKDFEVETFKAENLDEAISLFKDKRNKEINWNNGKMFFSIKGKEI